MADMESIDLYADVDDFGQTTAMQDQAVDGVESDLYDAMITTSTVDSEEKDSDIIVDKQESVQERRCPLYVGNLTWWTSDQDIIDVVASSGVTDVIEIKFHENRTNGQSKGFATVIVGSENSMHLLMAKLPKKELYGKPLVVTYCTKQNLKMFDDAAPSKPKTTNGDEVGSSDLSGNTGIGVPSSSLHRGESSGMAVYPPQPSVNSGLHALPPSMMMMPGGPGVVMRGPPPASGFHCPPGMVIHPSPRPDWNIRPVNAFPPQSNFMMNGHPASFHPRYNPARAPGRQHGDRFRKSHHAAPYHGREIVPQISKTEFEDILQKNKSISSGAISRANEDAASGDFPGAIETLVTAISLIWQSKIADDERCRNLITALQDTLQGIEQRSYTTKTLHSRQSFSRNQSDSDSDDEASKHRSRSRSRNRSRSQNRSDSKGSRENSRSRMPDDDSPKRSKRCRDSERSTEDQSGIGS